MMGRGGLEAVAGWLFGVVELYGWVIMGRGADSGVGQ